MPVFCSISETNDHRSGSGFPFLWFHYFIHKDRGQILQAQLIQTQCVSAKQAHSHQHSFSVIVLKQGHTDSISASSAGPTNFAPPPGKVRKNSRQYPAEGAEKISLLFFIPRKLRFLQLCLLQLIKKPKWRKGRTISLWRPYFRLLLQRSGNYFYVKV